MKLECRGSTITRTAQQVLALALAVALAWGWGFASANGNLPGFEGSPAWFDGGRPKPLAHEAVELLNAAASHGLDPLDYGADGLLQRVALATQGAPIDDAAAASLGGALSAALQRFLTDLHRGRIDPRQLRQTFSVHPRPTFDPAITLQAALDSGRLADAVRELAPRVPLYERLRGVLAHYRTLVDHAAWAQPLPPLPVDRKRGIGKLEAGQPWPGLERLAQRLAAFGDLPAATVAPETYEGPLVDAVRAFQQRHGLLADGVIGRATLQQLQVTPAARMRQIELTLERLRWTPLMQGQRMIVINIPEFVLRAYSVGEGGRITVQQEMKVIVGKAMDTRTPMFDEDMRFIEFSPYWNVPPSIARNEVLPRLRRDPGYFTNQGFEFVDGSGGVHTRLSSAAIDAVAAGAWRIRQRPGEKNALGDIKFVFPNQSNIYLHHTPSIRLFERDRRDFSHGCIRVEQPVALARFVLQTMPEWTEERILQAMAKGESSTLRLAEPVRVLIAYGTVLVKSGQVQFFDDIYGHDRLLDAALLQRSRALR